MRRQILRVDDPSSRSMRVLCRSNNIATWKQWTRSKTSAPAFTHFQGASFIRRLSSLCSDKYPASWRDLEFSVALVGPKSPSNVGSGKSQLLNIVLPSSSTHPICVSPSSFCFFSKNALTCALSHVRSGPCDVQFWVRAPLHFRV